MNDNVKVIIGYPVFFSKLEKKFAKPTKAKYRMEDRYDQKTGQHLGKINVCYAYDGFEWKIPKAIDSKEYDVVESELIEDIGYTPVLQSFEELFGCMVIEGKGNGKLMFYPQIHYADDFDTEIAVDYLDDEFKNKLKILGNKLNRYIKVGKPVITISWGI